jgi:F-type H+-transporting ATPase subunit b
MAWLQDAHVWEAIGLAVFIGALVWLKVPGMAMAALDSRGAKIQAQLDEATKLREEAQALLAEIKTRREAGERQAAEMLAQARADAERLAAEAKVKLDADIKRRQQLAERRIALAETQAAAEVRAAAADLAAEAAESVLAARIAVAKTDPLVDQSLEKLGERFRG